MFCILNTAYVNEAPFTPSAALFERRLQPIAIQMPGVFFGFSSW